jgi:CBS domain-containing protein
MPIVNEIMSTEVQIIGPEASLREAAQMMLELDVGALPVCRGSTLLGMVTDRDITVRGVAAGLAADLARVSEVMTKELEFCTEDQDTADVMRTMGYAQVRRLPVVNLDGELVGIVSLGDMARRQPGPVDQTVREISEPSTAGLSQAAMPVG